MIIAAALLVMALATQPTEAPKPKGISKSGSAKVSNQTKAPAESNKNPNPQPNPLTPSAIVMKDKPPTESKSSEGEIAKENVEIQRKLEIFTGLLVIAAFLQAGIFYWQGRVFRNTLNAINRQTGLLNDYVVATRDGVIAMRDSALAAKKTVQVLEAEQRARVGAAKVVLRSFHPGENVQAMLVLRNFGKSTAIHVKAEWYMEAEPEKKRSWHASGASDPDVFLYPDIDFALPIQTQGPISVDVFEAIGSGKLFLYVWGEVSYRILDEEQSRCASLFSFMYYPELREFLACGGFWQTEEAY